MPGEAAVRDRVERILTQWLGRVEVDEKGFSFPYESARVFLRFGSFTEEFTVVEVYTILCREVPLSAELYKWVAQTTDRYRFGHLGLYENADGKTCYLTFAHNLLGDFLDPDELKVAIRGVQSTSDQLDDEVVARFGGKRHADG